MPQRYCRESVPSPQTPDLPLPPVFNPVDHLTNIVTGLLGQRHLPFPVPPHPHPVPLLQCLRGRPTPLGACKLLLVSCEPLVTRALKPNSTKLIKGVTVSLIKVPCLEVKDKPV